MVPLIKDNRRQPPGGFTTETAVILSATVCLWITFLIMMTVVYWNFSSTMSAARAEFRPYAMAAINHTMSILANTDEATRGAHGVLDGAQSLSNQAVPALQHALNQSSAMIDRLERLAQNPVLQISMQQGPALGAGR